MEFVEMDALLKALEQLIDEIRLQVDDLDKTLHGEMETLRLQIDNLRS
ncbi:MAG: hypothetical protein LBI77_00595 [Puniceicoccales bacterium]|jgi:hypothetical protein|nr:hypothetical protein [Puniceicoccales bacterium]